jgi:cytochrome P450
MAINELVVGGSGSESDGRAAIAGLRRYSKHREFIQDHVRALIAEWRLSRWGGASLISYLAGLADPDEDGFGPFHQQVSLFLQASVETTASLLSWTLLCLARHPGYWDMLAEAQTASKHGAPEGDSSRRLMDAMLNESLRLYPPAWLLPRIARHDVRIGGVTVPSGARVIVSPWVTQRRENVFEDPLSFRPERWLKDDSRIARGGYFPFGLGNRICIGERYGKMTATIFLRQMVEAGVKPHVENPDLSVGSSAIILNVGHDVRISLTQQLP